MCFRIALTVSVRVSCVNVVVIQIFIFTIYLHFPSSNLDVDECAEGTHNCTGTCVNAVGTFRCVDRDFVSCGLGFRYDTATRECIGKSHSFTI